MPKQPAHIDLPSPHDWRTTDEDEINARRQRALTETFAVSNQDSLICEVIQPPLSTCWKDALAPVREFTSNPGGAWKPFADALAIIPGLASA